MSTATAPAPAKNSGIENIARTARDAKLNLDEIWMDQTNNARESYPDEEMEELRNSIEGAGGIMQPLQVIEVEPGEQTQNRKYVLVSGFRRYMCLETLGEHDPSFVQNVPCRILDISTEGGYKITQLMENLARSGLNWVEQAVGIKEVMSAPGNQLNAEEICRMVGMSPGRGSQLLKMLDLPKEVLEASQNGEISFSHAREIAYNVPVTAQLDMLKLGKTMTFGEFQKVINKKYHSAGTADTPDTAAQTDKGTQKAAQMIRADRLKSTYGKIFDELAKSTEDATQRREWEIRRDMINFVLRSPDTEVGKLVKPYEEKLEAEEEAEKMQKESGTKLQHFLKAAIARLRKYRALMPADGEVKPTINQDMAKVLAESKAEIEVAKTDAAKAKTLGFTVGTLVGKEDAPADTNYDDALAKLLAEAWQADVADRKKKAEEREAKKKEEEAKKKAEEEAKKTAETSAPAEG